MRLELKKNYIYNRVYLLHDNIIKAGYKIKLLLLNLVVFNFKTGRKLKFKEKS